MCFVRFWSTASTSILVHTNNTKISVLSYRICSLSVFPKSDLILFFVDGSRGVQKLLTVHFCYTRPTEFNPPSQKKRVKRLSLFLTKILTLLGPWRQCLVSLLMMTNGWPKKGIETLPRLCSKTGGAES